MKPNSINPLVSIIIPIRNSSLSLKACLFSIKNQTYKNIQIIIVTKKINADLYLLKKKFGFLLKESATGKSESRNVGSRLAKGLFLLHVDDDMVLNKKVVEECVKTAKTKNLKALVIPEKQKKGNYFLNALAVLEKKIVSQDKYVVAPRFIEKKLFFKLGGFDPHLDPIDDGDLKAKLKKNNIKYQNIKNIIKVVKTVTLIDRIVRMYLRGQKQELFNTLYPHSKQLKPLSRLWPYVHFFPVFFNHPILYILLICFKTLDLIVLSIGSINMSRKDKNYIAEIKNKSIFITESTSYQKEFYENSLGGIYVDKKEKEIVLNLLKNIDKLKKIKVLDIGAGGGRWSKLILETFPKATVVAIDLSEGMIDNLKENMKPFGARFSAIVGDMQDLPLAKESFDIIISIRAIKYVSDQDKVFSEIQRVLKLSGTAVIELPYANIFYLLIRKVNIFGKLSEYANRIQLRKLEEIVKSFMKNKLFLERFEIHFSIPSTFYKSVNNKLLLILLNVFNIILNKKLFGRSIFISLKKQQKLLIGVNSRIYQRAETGIPSYIQCLYQELFKIDKKNKYIFFQTNNNKVLGKTKIYNTNENIFLNSLFDLLFVDRFIKSEKIDIFHGTSNILPLIKRKNVIYVVTIHDLSFLRFSGYHSFLFNIYYKYAIMNSLKNADVVIVPSKNTKNDILKYYKIPEKKIKVIYLGVKELFLTAAKRKRIIKEKYYFSLITHIKRKNITGVLDSIKLSRKFQFYKYVIAGQISKVILLELKQKIKSLELDNQIILFGYASENQLISLYQNAEFLIYPSFYEGFGFPVLEAMACGCPVIASNNSSLLEITPNKKWLIDPYNPREMANKMKEMLNLAKNDRQELIRKNYLFSKKFMWEKTAKGYLKNFQ